MASPTFQPPEAPRRSSKRGYGKGWTRAEIDKRMEHLDLIGRRCDANGRKCYKHQAAVRLSVVALDQDGNRKGEPKTVQVCNTHDKVYDNSMWKILDWTELPPIESTPPRDRRRQRS